VKLPQQRRHSLPSSKRLPVASHATQEYRPGERFQFLRMGYFCVDSKHSQPGRPIFNRTTGLRDTWAKIQKKGA